MDDAHDCGAGGNRAAENGARSGQRHRRRPGTSAAPQTQLAPTPTPDPASPAAPPLERRCHRRRAPASLRLEVAPRSRLRDVRRPRRRLRTHRRQQRLLAAGGWRRVWQRRRLLPQQHAQHRGAARAHRRAVVPALEGDDERRSGRQPSQLLRHVREEGRRERQLEGLAGGGVKASGDQHEGRVESAHDRQQQHVQRGAVVAVGGGGVSRRVWPHHVDVSPRGGGVGRPGLGGRAGAWVEVGVQRGVQHTRVLSKKEGRGARAEESATQRSSGGSS
mmetsp:Transcript_32684/g.104126  ORF Transcript_32684/g.104126 Transcript_32684/m.104126 type:complete len:276 (-) Transcript_32684:110-937(-)